MALHGNQWEQPLLDLIEENQDRPYIRRGIKEVAQEAAGCKVGGEFSLIVTSAFAALTLHHHIAG
jgi:hypothetical protein